MFMSECMKSSVRVGESPKLIQIFFAWPQFTLYTHDFFKVCRLTCSVSHNVLKKSERLTEFELAASNCGQSVSSPH